MPDTDTPTQHGEVFTGLVIDTAVADGTGEPTLPVVAVKLTPAPFGVSPAGQLTDLWRFYSTSLGMAVLSDLPDVVGVDLTGWQVHAHDTTGHILDRDGNTYVPSIHPFPMWHSHTAALGNRVAVLYAPGLPMPTPDTDQIATIDYTYLARLCRRGLLLGGMATVHRHARATSTPHT